MLELLLAVRQLVANFPYCADVLSGVAQLFAQGADVHIHGPALHRDVSTPHHLQNGLAGDDKVGVFQQQAEQAVFFVSQLHRCAADSDAVAGIVQQDLPEAVDVGPCLGLCPAEGCNVVVNYCHGAEPAEQTAALCRAEGVQAVTVQADVSTAEGCKALFDAAAEAFGRVDVLVNNAGITRDNLILRLTEQDFDAVLDTNLKSAFLCCKEAARRMVRQRYGRIVNLSSVVALRGDAGQTNYAASKAGLIGLTKSLARELAARNVTVNAVAPGFIDTDMTAVLPETVRTGMTQGIPAGRAGQPEDVAQAVAFFAAEQSSYLTGQVLCVDGGMAM